MTSENPFTCNNCNAGLSSDSRYCHACGQKCTTGRISVRQLFSDFFSEEFSLDGRLIKSFLALFIPGKLTEEYFKGRHKSFLSPFRLFLIAAILFVTLLGYQTLSNSGEISLGETISTLTSENERRQVLHEMDSIHLSEKNRFNQPMVNQALDSVAQKLWQTIDAVEDSIQLNFNVGNHKIPKMDRDDIVQLSPVELGEKYGSGLGFWPKLFFVQATKAVKSGQGYLEYFFGKITISLFLMMPFLAAFLKLIYIRRKLYYVEHLVFSFHFHAFAFFVFALVCWLQSYDQIETGMVISLGFLVVFLYLLLSMKRIYQQGWIKTLLKIFIISIFYILLVSIFIVLNFILTFLLF